MQTVALALSVVALVQLAACSEPECGENERKVGVTCISGPAKRSDASTATAASDAGPSSSEDGGRDNPQDQRVDSGAKGSADDAGLFGADAGQLATAPADAGSIRDEAGSACVPSNAACNPPAQVAKVLEIAAGDNHTCARLASGAVSCWGSNSLGQLGIGAGNRIDQRKPTAVVGLTDAVELALGTFRSCARHASGAVSCWGALSVANAWVSVPTPVPGLTDAAALAGGDGQMCALRSNGDLVCWGNGGQLGTSGIADSDKPTLVRAGAAGDRIVSIAANQTTVCAATDFQGVSCWGSDSGVLSPMPAYSTVQIVGGVGGHMCGRARIGSGGPGSGSGVSCWGANASGQLGSAASSDLATKAQYVMNLPDAELASIAVGGGTSCALFASGSIDCWGNNSAGQLGDNSGTSRPAPGPVAGIDSARQVALGESHVCAVLADSTARCWGSNRSGQLGDGSTQDRGAPVAVSF